MKKAISLLLALAMVCSFAAAAFADFDLAQLTNDELLNLELQIQQEKITRGMVQAANIPKGSYTVGTDFPAGVYQVSTSELMCTVSVKNAAGKSKDLNVITPKAPLGKLTLDNGDLFEISSAVTLTVYAGGIVFQPAGGQETVSTPAAAQTPVPATQPQSNSGSLTMGQKNALGAAKNYLSFMSFSRSGLISQLQFEGYSESEATYAVDNCGADWFQQAVGSAKNYLSFMSFSKTGLIEQLEYEGYTHEQAVYGAEQNGY